MRVIELLADNVKRLRAAYIRPDGDMVVISGRNAQGKTSVLDAIWLALGGGDASKDVDEVIRRGQNQAEVRLDLGEFIVSRKWKRNAKGETASTLTVSNPDGSIHKSPQKMLDGLMARMAFDPLEFTRLGAKAQVDVLIDACGERDTLEAMDGERTLLMERRKLVNSKERDAQGALHGMLPVAGGTPDAEVDSAAIMARLAGANDARRAIDLAEADVRRLEKDGKDCVARVTELEKKLEAERAALIDLRAGYAAAKERLGALPQPPDTATLRAELADVDNVNKAVRAKKARAAQAELCETLGKQSAEMTAQIAALDARKASIIEGAKLPVDGLTFDGDGVRYNGTPFRDCSSSEQLRVSIAVSMSMNPKLRVMRVSDGPLLDKDSMNVLHGMATAHDFQVWVERVGDSGDGVIVIEDGEILTDGTIAENKKESK